MCRKIITKKLRQKKPRDMRIKEDNVNKRIKEKNEAFY